MTFIFQVKMYFKCIYWLLIYVINIVIISTWKWHWRPCSCEVEEMAWNFGTPWTKPSCFNRSYRFFGSIRYVSPVPHLVSDGALFNISSIQKKHEENINKWEIIVLYSQIFFSRNVGNSIKCEKNITPPPPPNHPHIWDTKSEQGN